MWSSYRNRKIMLDLYHPLLKKKRSTFIGPLRTRILPAISIEVTSKGFFPKHQVSQLRSYRKQKNDIERSKDAICLTLKCVHLRNTIHVSTLPILYTCCTRKKSELWYGMWSGQLVPSFSPPLYHHTHHTSIYSSHPVFHTFAWQNRTNVLVNTSPAVA